MWYHSLLRHYLGLYSFDPLILTDHLLKFYTCGQARAAISVDGVILSVESTLHRLQCPATPATLPGQLCRPGSQ
jgi:hypothetical protein